jgi:hypothetical protein
MAIAVEHSGLHYRYCFIFFLSGRALQRKSYLCISRKGIAWPQSQFPHSCIYERFIYSQDLSTYFPAAEKAERWWEYSYKSLTDI